MEEAAAERRYKAFISYRHRPLDMAIAKKLHKRIERYVIPKDLRKNEEKKLGLVFRDQDELPIANNLSENIRIALDHAEFLIVICSPDTPQSIWVQREISYFLEHHSRDNVLAVLISGEPDVSFPPQLTEVRSPDGDLLETIEPLAANIVADSDAKRNQLFKTESLRILASLIGCPYDALYRREQRYKMRRLAAAAIGIIAIAAAFIGLLLNRNAMIQEQLRTTQINESRTLAALSENASRDGDYRGALEDALNALPGRSPGRPYVAEAEKALGELVQPYRRGIQCLRFLQSVKQETEIRKLATPQNGTWFATSDRASQIHMYDLNSGEEKWSVVFPEEIYNMLTVEDTGLYVFGYGAPQILYSLEDGHILWQKEDSNISTNAVCSSKGWILEIKKENDRMIPFLIDARTGDTIRKLTAIDEFWSLRDTIISKDGKYAGKAFDYYGAIRSILADNEYICSRSLLVKIITCMHDTVINSHEIATNKESAISILLLIAVKYKDIATQYKERYEEILEYQDTEENTFGLSLFAGNVDSSIITFAQIMLSSYLGNDDYLELIREISKVKNDIATQREMLVFINEFLEINNTISLPESIEATLVQWIIISLQSNYRDLRYFSVSILIKLARKVEFRKMINDELKIIVSNDDVYIKNLIQGRMNAEGIDKATKSFIIEKFKTDSHYLVRNYFKI